MIWFLILPGLAGGFIGVGLYLSAKRGRQAVLKRRAARALIERNTRVAERQLHHIAHRTFTTMVNEARHPGLGGDAPWWT